MSPMEIDEEQADVDTVDAATSRAGKLLQAALHFVDRFGGRLESYCRVISVPADIIQLPDDDEEEPPRSAGGRSRALSKRASSSRASCLSFEPVVQELGDTSRATVSFDIPLSTDQPPVSIVQTSGPTRHSQPLITLHHVPEDQIGAAKEAMIQAGLMMDRLKVVCETSKAAYDASSALQTNVRVSGTVS
jgi:hypothetical protein